MTKTMTRLALLAGLLLLTGCSATPTKQADPAYTKFQSSTKATRAANSSLEAAIADTDQEIHQTTADIATLKADLADSSSTASSKAGSKATTSAKASSKTKATAGGATSPAALAAKSYAGDQELTVDNNAPGFAASELSTAHGAWERYANLDADNRAVVADALLNTSLMPTTDRTALTWDPTGWHNRRTAHGWLYNRSHLIGFQLSGENNNPKNLITGTQSLNNPLMLAHEMDIATYLKGSSKRYVRYQVRPIYRGHELVARGVQMRAQSVGDNTIRFNVYIFNVEDGYTINYATGTSTTN
ncbi:DNA/RNA non-specific endonuclease [Lacticaseibacillus parakribbianus]|uniref:DNA/RNA non-specific endonuclease n=1 Tax=Lacticaseibacillus parakribbianus TaxID=2970927 RepID=UPI0021CAEDCE|nr:DNA/RNA non-specific endonuclease [Lacticaseibacillus parakribbianus]